MCEDPDVLGFCFRVDESLDELLAIVKLLLAKMENVDSLQLVLAIVALLLSELAELGLKTKEKIRDHLNQPIKAIIGMIVKIYRGCLL